MYFPRLVPTHIIQWLILKTFVGFCETNYKSYVINQLIQDTCKIHTLSQLGSNWFRISDVIALASLLLFYYTFVYCFTFVYLCKKSLGSTFLIDKLVQDAININIYHIIFSRRQFILLFIAIKTQLNFKYVICYFIVIPN